MRILETQTQYEFDEKELQEALGIAFADHIQAFEVINKPDKTIIIVRTTTRQKRDEDRIGYKPRSMRD